MRKIKAAAGSVLFAVLAPGCVAGLVPWLLTGWHVGAGGYPAAVVVIGALLTAAGIIVLSSAFAQFAIDGLGTPAPIAPTATLVVRGLYKYVRNPMYLAVLAVILGQALILARPILFGYAAVIAALFVAFVRWYEQPTLTRRYGAQYQAYLRDVPGWWPRLRPGVTNEGGSQ
jgi:protein-S-isoprenylcysteine O-methyltransferase Ste14